MTVPKHLRRSAVIARHDLRVLRADPFYFIIFTTMPLIVMAFIKTSFRYALAADGMADANGAEHAVPGMAIMFSLFLMGSVGFGVFREHGWGTWDRLRASSATAPELLLGKSLVPLLQTAVQLTILFVVGGLLYDLEVHGSVIAIVLVAASFALTLVALGHLLAAFIPSIMVLSAASNLGAIVLAGLGGALAPISAMPGWARAIGPAVPSYWAMRGFDEAILDGGGVPEVVRPVLVLLAFAGVFGALAVRRFRVDEAKTFFA